MSAIEVRAPGLQTTVQDLGRPASVCWVFRRLGLPTRFPCVSETGWLVTLRARRAGNDAAWRTFIFPKEQSSH